MPKQFFLHAIVSENDSYIVKRRAGSYNNSVIVYIQLEKKKYKKNITLTLRNSYSEYINIIILLLPDKGDPQSICPGHTPVTSYFYRFLLL